MEVLDKTSEPTCTTLPTAMDKNSQNQIPSYMTWHGPVLHAKGYYMMLRLFGKISSMSYRGSKVVNFCASCTARMNGEFHHHHNHHTMIFNHHLCFSTCIGIVLIVVPFPRNDKHESITDGTESQFLVMSGDAMMTSSIFLYFRLDRLVFFKLQKKE